MLARNNWVKARYDGARAKSVMAHAAAGIGYHILTEISPTSVIAAFRIVGRIPSHCEKLTGWEIQKVEEKELRRMGIR